MNKKIAIIFGTRPEIIKLAPVIRECKSRKMHFLSLHTEQHYSFEMDEVFFRQLKLDKQKYRLNIKSKAPFLQGDHTGRMLIEIEQILLKEMPYCIIVQGDTNTVLAAALTAEKISTTEHYTGFHIKVAHVEAGLRSFDRSMPEETNRFIVDHLSDYLFVPTKQARIQLIKEGIPQKWVHITGNTIVDATMQSKKLAQHSSQILKKLPIKKSNYILLTMHRQENVDCKKTFQSILKGIELTVNKLNMPAILPIHPRTKKQLNKFNLTLPKNVIEITPVGFLDFLWLEKCAKLILTDSGGVQEEACILKVPCVTLRNNTERPETVDAGANIIAGTKAENILKASLKMVKRKKNWHNPFGNGKASEKIINTIINT